LNDLSIRVLLAPDRWTAAQPADRHAAPRVSGPDLSLPAGAIVYTVQPGDTLIGLVSRYGVDRAAIQAVDGGELPANRLLEQGRELLIQPELPFGAPAVRLLPDSELVFSPGALGFEVGDFVASFGGYLTIYRQRVDGEWLSGAQVIERVALEYSVNPRLLLAILEYRTGWLTDPRIPLETDRNFPLWIGDGSLQGLYLQLTWAANELSKAYYGWREGRFLELQFADGSSLPLAPDSNAGSVAVQHLLTHFNSRPRPDFELAGERLMLTYSQLFGDPWAMEVPLLDAAVSQPDMILPFSTDHPWLFTGGPHGAWGTDSGWAALDFAPKWDRETRSSHNEVLAVADGRVVRLEPGVIILDLDRDGLEQTGWSVLYLHIIPASGIVPGAMVAQGEPLGFAAEVGGVTHGLHLHIARKYNGEWILADGPLPMSLGGWQVRAGAEPYQGVLFREGCELLACPCASQSLLSVGGGSDPGLVIQPVNLIGCCPSPFHPTPTLDAGPITQGVSLDPEGPAAWTETHLN
jgi:murein DD-endopeptidase MepM/ murein hydrolase activator NlpD